MLMRKFLHARRLQIDKFIQRVCINLQSEDRFLKLRSIWSSMTIFQADVGVELDDLALPGEVKLDFLYIKIELKQSISWAALFGLDLELDFIIKIQ